ncbi:MAG: IPT/TIG domain-containing protein, partial [Candidatus Nomurabacteria bacterium]|nr:IPT/TIG domain-containing protein [Candidatus Nomurabacteria bacterium]
MSTVNANISLSPNPFANEGVASTSSTVTLTTNVFTGYNLTLSTNSTNDNGLVPQNVGSPTPLHTIPIAAIGNGTTTGTITNPIVLTNNTWGFAIPKVASSSPTNTIINNFDTAYTTPKPNTTSKWASVPKQGSPVTIKNTAQAASNDSTIVYYAAKVGADLPPDEYKQTIMYTATANTDIGNIPAPTIISITPNQGPTTGNTNITIVGTNFTKYDQSITTSVTIGGKVCNNVQISSNTPSGQSPSQDTITCITQDNTVGKKNVTVATWSSGSPAVNGDDVGETGFTYVQLPVVTSVSPNQGVTEGGTVITVAGTGFGLYSLNGYEYTTCGSYQTFTANVNGDYKLDVYGAQGGTASSKTGGKGGFSTGKVALNVGDVLYVYVGCAGSTGSAGGWNGGGGAASTTSSGTGGGASDIRLVANASPTNLTSLQSRIIVAGGGAGSGQDSCATAITGYGGGETGGGGASQGDCGTQAGGGTQSAGGGGGVYGSTTGAAGQFGIGGTAINAS